MAMNLLLESLSRCLNGTSTVRGGSGGMASSAGLGNNANDDDDQFEPAAVQVRLRDHARRSTSSRRRSTTPQNRNGRRRPAHDPPDDDEQDLVHVEAEADAVDRLADARRDAHEPAGSHAQDDEDRPSTGSRSNSSRRRRRRQRSAPKLTVEERRNDIFRLPSDHPASRPSSPADHPLTSGADPHSSTTAATSRSRSSPRIRVVTPEPLAQPLGLMCGRTSPAVAFRRGSSVPNTTSSTTMSMSNLLRDSTKGGLRALCFASPVRDAHEVAADEQRRAAANAARNNEYPADDRTVDTVSVLLNDHDPTDDPTVNTADYTYATQDDTVASTHYFDAKLAHLVETSPPMPLYRQYEVTGTNPDHDIRKIVETNSHRSSIVLQEAGVDLAGGLINVVKKKWSSPDRTGHRSTTTSSRAAPQSQPQARRESSRGVSRRQPTTTTTTSSAHRTSRGTAQSSSSRSPSSSPAARPKETSSDDPPTPPRHPRGYREEVAVAAAAAAARGGRRSTSGGGKLSGHPNPSEDSSVPSLEFSRNSSQSTSPSI